MGEKKNEFISKSTAALEIDSSIRTIERFIERGLLKKYKIGYVTRIRRDEFDEFKKRYVISEAV